MAAPRTTAQQTNDSVAMETSSSFEIADTMPYIQCGGQEDCARISGTCFDGFCYCVAELRKLHYGERCDRAYKDCENDTDCEDPEASCKHHLKLNKKICFCPAGLQPAYDGLCPPAKSVNDTDRKDTFEIKDLFFGLGSQVNQSHSNNVRQNNTSNFDNSLSVQPSNIWESSILLQILLPSVLFSFLLFIVILILFKRTSLCRRNRRKCKAAVRSSENEQLLDRLAVVSKNQAYFTTLDEITKERQLNIKDISMKELKILEVIGEGAFGQVFKGVFLDNDGAEKEKVAIKVLKEGMSNQVRDDFEREVRIMSSFSHANILRLIGIVTKDCGSNPYMVFEFMEHGDLAELLRRNDPGMKKSPDVFSLQKTDLVDIAVQIASGMTYLTSQHFVHRDLATRNCLVGENLSVKISDFGMSRDIYISDYYRVGGSRMLPVRWMSPESVKYGRFTTESDIWAYGVVLWEIFSFGRQPYYGHSNEEVVRFLEEGILLQRPEECPSTVYHVMLGCWKSDPSERLLFPKIHKHLVDFSKTLLADAVPQSFAS